MGICVADLERSLRFYCDGLGFSERGRLDVAGPEASTLLGLPDAKLRAVYLERDGTRIELLWFAAPSAAAAPPAPRPVNQPGLTHLSFRVADLDATLAALTAAGGVALPETRIHNPAFRSGAVFLTDPDGTRIELVEAPGDPAALPGARSD